MKIKAKISIALIAIIAILSVTLVGCTKGMTAAEYVQPKFNSKNVVDGAKVIQESNVKENKTAENILKDDGLCWNAKKVKASYDALTLDLKETSTFNTAVVKEVGNNVQYFHLQYLNNQNKWVDFYQGEKIQNMAVLSFDQVTTKKVKIIIGQFRKSSAMIDSIALYNEQNLASDNFTVAAYQRLDDAVPTEVLAQGEEYVKDFARYYDVYNTVIIFGAVNWDKDGNMSFGDYAHKRKDNPNYEPTEKDFEEQIAALKEIISHKTNPHKVKIVCGALADGAFGGGHDLVNEYMVAKNHWKKVADQMIDFMKKYDFDGLDIDWEYPATEADWKGYDQFMAYLKKGMREYKEDAILSAALSAGALNMSKETLDLIDQIQFMAYDGHDIDGYQSSLDQAQVGLVDFVKNGGKDIIKKVNIGIASYGRPTAGGPYWPSWKDCLQANYWDSIYQDVYCPDGNKNFYGAAAFCSPAVAGNKTTYALLSGVGGVMTFRLACDKLMTDENAVACGIENALKRYCAEWNY